MHHACMDISVVLPCFNEEENIEHTVREVLSWFVQENIDGEVIVVNDGSTDHSAEILTSLAQKNTALHVVTHQKNTGYGLAVRSGLDAAQKTAIAFMDSDGQFHIADLGKLLSRLSTYDLVTGRRRKRADSMMRNILGKVLGILVFIVFGLWIRDVNCGMKVMKKSLWPTLRPLYGTEKFFNTELYLRAKRAGIAWQLIDVPHYPRRAGTPTGGSGRVIFGMLKELYDLRRKVKV